MMGLQFIDTMTAKFQKGLDERAKPSEDALKSIDASLKLLVESQEQTNRLLAVLVTRSESLNPDLFNHFFPAEKETNNVDRKPTKSGTEPGTETDGK